MKQTNNYTLLKLCMFITAEPAALRYSLFVRLGFEKKKGLRKNTPIKEYEFKYKTFG